MRLFKQLVGVFVVLGVLVSVLMVFSFDVVKIQWVSFMGLQPSYSTQEFDLATGQGSRPVPALSIPIEGAAYIPANGAPENPIPADEISISRGEELYRINCMMCHGDTGLGTGTVAGFLVKKKPVDLTSDLVQSLSDGDIFLTITNGKFNPDDSLFPDIKFSGQCPPLNENLSVRERWDVINYIRTLKALGQ
ncbi:MAG: cytochrome c [Chloroflexi bacterium]|nr:cytochrome c [Chloroflexota bacterium]